MKYLLSIITILIGSVVSGQEISCDGQPETTPNQYLWLKITDLPNGSEGRFDVKAGEYNGFRLDDNPKHVVPGSAVFSASNPGEYRVSAAYAVEGKVEYLELFIVVKGDSTSTDEINERNVRKWLAEVAEESRNRTVKNEITGDNKTVQRAVADTFRMIGDAGASLKSKEGMDVMLATALKSVWEEDAKAWAYFAEAVDNGLAELKKKEVSVEEYVKAYHLIAGVLEK